MLVYYFSIYLSIARSITSCILSLQVGDFALKAFLFLIDILTFSGSYKLTHTCLKVSKAMRNIIFLFQHRV